MFVIEEESDPNRFSIHRLVHYCTDISELLATRRVVPVVVFLRGSPAERTFTLGGDRDTYLRFRFLSVELALLPYRRYRNSANLVARLNLPNMRYKPDEKVDVYAAAVRGLTSLESDPERQRKYADFIDIYSALDDTERQRYERDYPEEAQTVNSFSQLLRRNADTQCGAIRARKASAAKRTRTPKSPIDPTRCLRRPPRTTGDRRLYLNCIGFLEFCYLSLEIRPI